MTADGDPEPSPSVDEGAREPDDLVRRAGVRADTDRDQHFLVDDRVLDRVPSYLPADADRSHVLEIGGGVGPLTDRLLATDGVDRVTVVERDGDLAAFLREEFADAVAADRLHVLDGDAVALLDGEATAAGERLDDWDACVSNLPYGASSALAFGLLPRKRPLVLMFQREFAERMVADPDTDDYGRLSVSARHYAGVDLVEHVPKEAFDPQPAVQSAVVRCRPRDPTYTVPDEDFFLDFVKALFTQRRKTIRNGIRNTAHISGLDDPEAVVEAADEELLGRRAGKLPPETFAELATLSWEVGVTGDAR
ncbi:MAG: 16S ribosomal RNA methyltransferase A [Halolamina sp.]